MARRWTLTEEQAKYEELFRLYVTENKTLRDVANLLGLAESTAYERLVRLGIPSTPEKKERYPARRRSDVVIPQYCEDLAEFFGIMLGDGKLSYYQVVVTLGTKELSYAEHICDLMEKLFRVRPKIGLRSTGYRDVYIGSRDISEWLQREGLVYNKVLSQVDAPRWIFSNKKFKERFLRGFFDTDGSIYRLRFGLQISLTNKSMPLLRSGQRMLKQLGYQVSKITTIRCYVTKRNDVLRFFEEIKPANPKHVARFHKFSSLGR